MPRVRPRFRLLLPGQSLVVCSTKLAAQALRTAAGPHLRLALALAAVLLSLHLLIFSLLLLSSFVLLDTLLHVLLVLSAHALAALIILIDISSAAVVGGRLQQQRAACEPELPCLVSLSSSPLTPSSRS